MGSVEIRRSRLGSISPRWNRDEARMRRWKRRKKEEERETGPSPNLIEISFVGDQKEGEEEGRVQRAEMREEVEEEERPGKSQEERRQMEIEEAQREWGC